MPALKPTAQSGAVALLEIRVAMVLDSRHCLLANGRQASRALGCLIAPQVGDQVLVSQGENSCHVLQILERNGAGEMEAVALCLPGDGAIHLRGSSVGIHGSKSVTVDSGGDVDVTAAGGHLGLNARNLFMSVTDSLVQQAQHFIGKAGQYFLDVRHLLKLHGQDALITAERDIKADAERISMG